jgi:hypothetical protein
MTVDELGSKFDRNRQSGLVARPDPPADAVARFKHEDRPSGSCEFRGRGQSGGPGADDDDIHRHG